MDRIFKNSRTVILLLFAVVGAFALIALLAAGLLKIDVSKGTFDLATQIIVIVMGMGVGATARAATLRVRSLRQRAAQPHSISALTERDWFDVLIENAHVAIALLFALIAALAFLSVVVAEFWKLTLPAQQFALLQQVILLSLGVEVGSAAGTDSG